MVNCAGYVDAGDILSTQARGYDLSFDLNVHATMRVIRAVLPGMIARRGGSIVNIASIGGR